MAIGATVVAAISLSRVLWHGPALAGNTIVWAEASNGAGSIHRSSPSGEEVLYRSDLLAVGGSLAASPKRLAFERSYPGCPPQPGVACPQLQDALAGPPRGPFRRLVPPRKCSMASTGNTLALDGRVAAYIQLDCDRQRLRVVVRDLGSSKPPVVVRDAPLTSGCCSDVEIAGRFVAWNERSTVVVYDRFARRTAYLARIGPAGISVDLGFDLQADGSLGVAYRLVEVARAGPANVAWLSPAAPRLHMLKLKARDTRIRMAGDQLTFERYISPQTGTLVVADLAGHARTVARFVPPLRFRGGFDFDGRHITWASDLVASTRTDCPPPGQGRPCVLRETGVTTIWFEDLASGRRRAVASLPFVDEAVHPNP